MLYNDGMTAYHVYTSIQVRYSDLDPQWHVNNARYLSYLEQARVDYIRALDLWDGQDFFRIGLIVADIHIAYLAPINLGQRVRVGIRTTRIGNKSLQFAYTVEDEDSGKALASAESVMVAYDYRQQISIPVPTDWRVKINAFDGLDEAP
jgi:acyl-CoA thioester hydrolase